MSRPSPPVALLALLAVAAILGVAWTVVIPPFQQPDEADHIARTQRTGEGVREPPFAAGKKWSSQEENAVYGSDSLRVFGNEQYKPPATRAQDQALRTADGTLPRPLRRDMNGHTVADDNPSGYYRYTSVFYRLGGDFFTRLWVVRLGGLVMLLLTTLGVWLLAGELFRDRRLQVVATTFAALQPMVESITSAVSPDGMLIACSTLSLWLTVRVLRRGPTWRGVLALAVVVALACLTKSPGYALVPAAAIAVLVALVRRRRPQLRLNRRQTIAAVAGGAVALAAVYALLRVAAGAFAPQLSATIAGVDSPRRFASYVWQFYFGPQDWLQTIPNLGQDDRFSIAWIKQGWGLFGNLDTPLPDGLYTAIVWVGWLVIVLALVGLVRHRDRIDWAVLVVLALAGGVLLLGLHITEYRVFVALGAPFLQGRYILPLVGLGGLVVAAAIAALPTTWRTAGAGVVVGASLSLQLIALYTVAVRFHAG